MERSTDTSGTVATQFTTLQTGETDQASPLKTDSVGGTDVEKVQGVALTALPLNPTDSSPPRPVSTYTVVPKSYKEELTKFLSEDISQSKIDESKESIKAQKQKRTDFKMTMVFHGALLALGLATIVAAVAVTWVFCPGIGGVLVTGLGLVAGSALVSYSCSKMAHASHTMKESEIKDLEVQVERLKKALELIEQQETTKPTSGKTFKDFLNNEFAFPYMVSDLGTYQALYEKHQALENLKSQRDAITAKNQTLETELADLRKSSESPSKELQKAMEEREQQLSTREARNPLIPAWEAKIKELEAQIAKTKEHEQNTQHLLAIGSSITNSEKELVFLREQLAKFQADNQQAELRIAELNSSINTILRGQFESEIADKQARLDANKASITQLESDINIHEKDFTQAMKVFEDSKAAKTDKKEESTEVTDKEGKSSTPPPQWKAWVEAKDTTTQPKTWEFNPTAASTNASPLYMLGNYAQLPDNWDEERKKQLEGHGLHSDYAFLSASDTSETFTVDGQPYKSPIHYVLQHMAPPDVAGEIARAERAKDALKIALENAQEQHYTQQLQKNHEAATQLLKRALVAKFVSADGVTPTVAGKRLMDTGTRPLVAAYEPSLPGWGWAASLGEDGKLIGHNKLGTYLEELRAHLIKDAPMGQSAGANTGMPTPPHPPTTETPTAEVPPAARTSPDTDKGKEPESKNESESKSEGSGHPDTV